MNINFSVIGTYLVPRTRVVLVAAILLPVMVACSDGSDQQPVVDALQPAPFAEIFQQGIVRYLGLFAPILAEQDGPVTTHYFAADADAGPICGDGSAYSMATRDQGSEDLMIFLEGGGACWSDFCFFINSVTPGIPQDGLLDTARVNNPVKDWSVAYVPYCDGSLLAGDVDVDSDGDGNIDRFQHGLQNLSAALDVTVRTFPAPRRILLAGQSGGALGTIFALPMVRHMYPGVPIDVLNDSGVGVLKPGKPEFLHQIVAEWNLSAFIPQSCADCIAPDGHLTDYLIWQMDQDPDLRRAMLSNTQDVNLADLFLGIGGPAFETALLEEMQQQENAYPQRMHSWIVDGNGHTFVELQPDATAGGVPLMDWIGYMLSGSDQWVSVKDASIGQ
ncbi:MAG: pectin acetylesterase-family hydrolase [Halioglobus sp.]